MDHSLEDEFDPTHFSFFHLFSFSLINISFVQTFPWAKWTGGLQCGVLQHFSKMISFFFNHPLLYLRTFLPHISKHFKQPNSSFSVVTSFDSTQP